MGYAALAGGPSTPPPCGDQAILDPFTGQCHCSDEMIRDPSAPNDCVDPAQLCAAADETWSEGAGGCVKILPTVTIVASRAPASAHSGPTGAPATTQAGIMIGWSAAVAMGAVALYLFATHVLGGRH
jgi:hypothetical protein